MMNALDQHDDDPGSTFLYGVFAYRIDAPDKLPDALVSLHRYKERAAAKVERNNSEARKDPHNDWRFKVREVPLED